MELPLYLDQINSESWISLCDHVFDEHDEPFVTSMVNRVNNLQLFGKQGQLWKDKGVIFCGTTQSITRCLKSIPKEGQFILITRDNDQSITQDLYKQKPDSVKHWFAINCTVKENDITAIPYGSSPLGGMNKTLQIVCEQTEKENNNSKIWCTFTIPPVMTYPHERHKCREALSNNIHAVVHTEFIDVFENYQYIRKHKYVACPFGSGADTMRISESIVCGAIPIVSDIPEMWHFYDLPIILTKDWINFSPVTGNSTDKIRMSYWEQQLLEKKKQLFN